MDRLNRIKSQTLNCEKGHIIIIVYSINYLFPCIKNLFICIYVFYFFTYNYAQLIYIEITQKSLIIIIKLRSSGH